MTHSHVNHDASINVTRFILTRDMTHSHVWHDSYVWWVTWLIYMCDMTHSNMWYDAFVCVTCLFHKRDTTHSYMWHDSCMHVTWRIHACNMTWRIHTQAAWYRAVFLCFQKFVLSRHFLSLNRDRLGLEKTKNIMLFVHLNLKYTWHWYINVRTHIWCFRDIAHNTCSWREDVWHVRAIEHSCVWIPSATHSNVRQHTATHCNTLQYTATHYNTLATRTYV